MIHATIHGVILDDATYQPPSRDEKRANQASAFFSIATRQSRTSMVVECSFRGRGSTVLHPHLIAGKRVVVSGLISLSERHHPHLVISVHHVEIVGGLRTGIPISQRPEFEDDDASL